MDLYAYTSTHGQRNKNPVERIESPSNYERRRTCFFKRPEHTLGQKRDKDAFAEVQDLLEQVKKSMEPSSNMELLFLDESEIHLYPHLFRKWMPKGRCVEVPAPDKNQKIPIYGALNCRTNKVSYQIGYGKNTVEFLGFLAQLAHDYGDKHCILVLDNTTYHTACIVQEFLDELSCRFQVIWLPPYCPELNNIKHIWKYVKGASLVMYDFGDVANLHEAIAEVFDEINSYPEWDLKLRFRDPLSKNLLEVV